MRKPMFRAGASLGSGCLQLFPGRPANPVSTTNTRAAGRRQTPRTASPRPEKPLVTDRWTAHALPRPPRETSSGEEAAAGTQAAEAAPGKAGRPSAQAGGRSRGTRAQNGPLGSREQSAPASRQRGQSKVGLHLGLELGARERGRLSRKGKGKGNRGPEAPEGLEQSRHLHPGTMGQRH